MTDHSPQHRHEIARRTVLIALARYGYLRASDIALLAYFDKLSGLRMAQRLLAKMNADALVLRRDGRAGQENHYALSGQGAAEATRLTGVTYRSGKDLLRSISGHRDAANRVCVLAQAAKFSVVTEREICRDPGRSFLNKIPDALIFEDSIDCCGGSRRGYTWVEVEHSYRSSSDLDTLSRFVLDAFADERYCVALRDGWLDEVHLVISDPVAMSIGHRLKRRLAELTDESAVSVKFWPRIRVLLL